MTHFGKTAAADEAMRAREAIRKRPHMYLGMDFNDAEGPDFHQLALEIISNAVDEARRGYCRNISVNLRPDGSISIADDGRGIPVSTSPKHPDALSVQTVMTDMHEGSKGGEGAYGVSGGLHGIGAAVVNFLSEWMHVEVAQGGKVYSIDYCRGEETQPLRVTGSCTRTGTKITFRPDRSILPDWVWSFQRVASHCQKSAFLTDGLAVTIHDESTGARATFQYANGLVEYVKCLNQWRTAIHPAMSITKAEPGEMMHMAVAMQYHNASGRNLPSYVNGMYIPGEGSHVRGFETGLWNALIPRAASGRWGKLDVQDLMEGLTAVVSVTVPSPNLETARKDVLLMADVEDFMAQAVTEGLDAWLTTNHWAAEAILGHLSICRSRRIA